MQHVPLANLQAALHKQIKTVQQARHALHQVHLSAQNTTVHCISNATALAQQQAGEGPVHVTDLDKQHSQCPKGPQ